MVNNKKGLSAVIVTLLLVMLSIVLVGIVFVVVNNVVSTGTSQVSSGAKCLSSGVEVTSATCSQAGTCNVTVQRTTGSDTIDGVTLVFYDAAQDSAVNNTAGNIETPASKRILNINSSITNVTKIDAAVYFNDKSGAPSPCSGTTEFTNVQLVA